MHEPKKEILLRLLRVGVMCSIGVFGVICGLTIPDRGMGIGGACCLIAFSYMCVLYRSRGQWYESLILLTVIGFSIAGYFNPLKFGRFLLFPLVVYLAYGMGRAFIFKIIKDAFRDPKQTNRAK